MGNFIFMNGSNLLDQGYFASVEEAVAFGALQYPDAAVFLAVGGPVREAMTGATS